MGACGGWMPVLLLCSSVKISACWAKLKQAQEQYSLLNHMEKNKELLCHIRIWSGCTDTERSERKIHVCAKRRAKCFALTFGMLQKQKQIGLCRVIQYAPRMPTFYSFLVLNPILKLCLNSFIATNQIHSQTLYKFTFSSLSAHVCWNFNKKNKK